MEIRNKRIYYNNLELIAFLTFIASFITCNIYLFMCSVVLFILDIITYPIYIKNKKNDGIKKQ